MLLPFLELVEGPVPVDGDVLSSVLETFDHLLNLSTRPACLCGSEAVLLCCNRNGEEV
jgi:hypothetical protein